MSIRLHNLPYHHLLTQDQCAEIAGCATSTIAKHRLGGLLAYKPTRPITIPAWSFRAYVKMMSNGVRSSLHRTLHIDAADAAVYSRLDGVISVADKPDAIIKTVVAETESLWRKYKAAKKERDKRQARRAAA